MRYKSLPGLIICFFYLSVVYSQQKITLEAIYKEHMFFPKVIQGIRSMQDGEHYTIMNQFFYVDKYSYETGDFIKTIFSVKDINNPPFNFFDGYEFSKDETKILLTTKTEQIYRHSFRAEYYIFDLITKRLQPLSENHSLQQTATFSPDGRKVAYVNENNLFVKDLHTGIENQISTDGEKNKIINGLPDWVYEEEFGFSKAFEWSPDNKKIAFYKFDETRVNQFKITLYNNELYPQWYQYKYPKAGEENSFVTIHVFDTETGDIKKMHTGDDTDYYIPRIKWTVDSGTLSIFKLNRLQNRLEVMHANATTGESEVIYQEENKYFISELNDNTLVYLKNGSEFLIVSELNGWKHIYKYNFVDKTTLNITDGEYDIGEIIAIDEANDLIYFTSHENSPLVQDVYGIKTDGTRKKRLTSGKGWNSAQFSANAKYFVLTHSTASKPFVFSLHTSSGKYIRTMEDNSELVKIRKNFGFQNKEFFSFTTSYDLLLNGYMIKPPGFKKNNKYPVFMFVYGGPESQSVTDRYISQDNWFQMLAQMGYLVVCVDNRGTDNRGEEFRKSTYMQLGKLETEDQIETALYLGKLPYVDNTRIGIYGWSYGGYMSLLCLFKAADIFKMAISVAPVTNWRFYDTIYTERFMRTPQENPSGYDDNSPTNHVNKMNGKLLLIHGMADDNVHLQNSADLIEKLVQAGKQFDMQLYPNKNHSIHGGNTSYHLYERMTRFVEENL